MGVGTHHQLSSSPNQSKLFVYKSGWSRSWFQLTDSIMMMRGRWLSICSSHKCIIQLQKTWIIVQDVYRKLFTFFFFFESNIFNASVDPVHQTNLMIHSQIRLIWFSISTHWVNDPVTSVNSSLDGKSSVITSLLITQINCKGFKIYSIKYTDQCYGVFVLSEAWQPQSFFHFILKRAGYS